MTLAQSPSDWRMMTLPWSPPILTAERHCRNERGVSEQKRKKSLLHAYRKIPLRRCSVAASSGHSHLMFLTRMKQGETTHGRCICSGLRCPGGSRAAAVSARLQQKSPARARAARIRRWKSRLELDRLKGAAQERKSEEMADEEEEQEPVPCTWTAELDAEKLPTGKVRRPACLMA